MQNKILGIILTVVGASAIIWCISRFTSFYGKMHSWSPPFTEYETITIVSGIIGLILLIVGIVFLAKKQVAK